jgi:signal transduction histidine kinase
MTDKRAFDDERHEAQRLESMGHLAAGVAEDIDAPAQQLAASLRTLADNLTVLLDGRPIAPGERQPAAAIERALAEAEEGVARIASVVRAVQEFSRPGSEAIELADVNAALRSAAIVCRASWKNIADLEFDLAADLPPVPCHVADLNQVFLSLIVNAADAVAGGATMGAKGRIVVTTRAVGEQVEITVRDNGPGIPETVAARVFEPAFTTKGAGNRTGQGLAACRAAIVDKHGGTLTFDSLPGVATTFRIRLPLARQAVRRAS